MIAAVSTSILAQNAPPPAPASTGKKSERRGSGDARPQPTARFFFKLPELSDETAAAITKASAWPAFIGVCRAIREQQRRGRTEKIRELASEKATIGIGIKQLCRTIGLSPKAGREQLRKLEKLGLVHVHRPPPVIKAHPITGRIVEKRGGKSPRTLIVCTVTDEHCRPCKVRSEPPTRVRSEPPSGSYKGRSEPPSKDYSNKYQRRRQPPSSGESGGGCRQAPEARPPVAFTGPEADAVAYTREKLAREAAQREAEAAERQARLQAQTDEQASLEATPMNPATVRAADAATAAGKPPHSIRESRSDDRPRTAVLPRPTPSQPRPPTAADRAALDVLNDTPKEVIEAKQWKGFNSRKEMLLQQLAADTLREAERASNGVAMTRATIPIEQQPKESAPGLLKQVWQRLTG